MTTQNIYDLTDTWNSGGTSYAGIKMNVTDAASASDSKLLQLQVGSADKFAVDKSGNATLTSTDAGATAGPTLTFYRNSATPAASDILGKILFQGEDSAGNTEDYAEIQCVVSDTTSASEDATIQFRGKVAGTMTTLFTAAATGNFNPGANDGGALGTSGTAWSDIFLATGAVINFNAGGETITHAANALTFAGFSSGYTFNDGGITVGTGGITISAGGLTATGKGTFTNSDSGTNTVLSALKIARQSSGTPALGIGVSMEFEVETAAGGPGNLETGMTIEAVTTDVTAASEDFDFVVKLMAAGATAAEKLRVTSAGNLTATGDVTAYSDPLLKDEIAPLEDALDLVDAIGAVRFTWNGLSPRAGQRDIGFLSDAVKAVLPEAVKELGDYDTVAYAKLVAVAFQAIRELRAEVRELTSYLEPIRGKGY